MKEGRVRNESATDSETSLTLIDDNRFHPYHSKKQASTLHSPKLSLNTINNRRELRSLMNTQRIFAHASSCGGAASSIDESGSNCLDIESLKKKKASSSIHTTYSSSSSQEEVAQSKERCTCIQEDDLSKDITLVKEENFEFLDSIDFSDCLELEMLDFDQSFSINKAASLDGVSTSYQSSPDLFLKPRCREPSIEWNDDENFQSTSPNSPTVNNREISTLELLLEKPLEDLLYHSVNKKDDSNN